MIGTKCTYGGLHRCWKSIISDDHHFKNIGEINPNGSEELKVGFATVPRGSRRRNGSRTEADFEGARKVLRPGFRAARCIILLKKAYP